MKLYFSMGVLLTEMSVVITEPKSVSVKKNRCGELMKYVERNFRRTGRWFLSIASSVQTLF